MASAKEKSDADEWEEVNMLMELPNGANLNVTKKDLYLQVAGMWSEQPVVKLDNMLYVGKVSSSLGSILFVECKDGDGTKATQKKKNEDREVIVSDTYMKLEPIFLKRKTGLSQDQPSNQSSKNAKEK